MAWNVASAVGSIEGVGTFLDASKYLADRLVIAFDHETAHAVASFFFPDPATPSLLFVAAVALALALVRVDVVANDCFALVGVGVLELVDELGNPVVDTSNDLTATVSAGPGGTVEAAVPIPDDLAPGNYTILADSEKLDGSAFHAEFAFSVSSEAQPEGDPVDGSDDAANGPDLAFTGASSLALAVSASMLIVLGGGLVLSTKRETTDS